VVIACAPVNVFAASVRAIVALVDGNVIVVASVPARVRVFDAESILPSVIFTPIYDALQEAAVVPEVRIQVNIARVFPARIRTTLAPDEFTVTAPVLLFRT